MQYCGANRVSFPRLFTPTRYTTRSLHRPSFRTSFINRNNPLGSLFISASFALDQRLKEPISPTTMPEQPYKAEDASFKVLHVADSLVTTDGSTILSQLPSNCCSSRSLDGDNGVVLGLSSDTPTACMDVAIGKLAASRFLALPRTSLWWMTPHWGSKPSHLPTETQFLLIELPNNKGYALLLPLIDTRTFRATLRPPPSSSKTPTTTTTSESLKDFIGLRIESGASTVTASQWGDALYVAAGSDPFELLRQGISTAASLSGTAKPRSVKQIPETVEYFGWCTWDAFYSRVSAAGIQQGLKSLVQGGAPAKWLIIDDGWQQTDVDEAYRIPPPEEGNIDRLSSSTSGTIAASSAVSLQEASAELEAVHAEHEVKEAVAELLTGPGDQVPGQLHGEHALVEEEVAAAVAASLNDGASLLENTTTTNKKAVAAIDTTPTGFVSALLQLMRSTLNTIKLQYKATVAHIETAIFHACRRLINRSSHDSLVIRIFTKLLQGPLREVIRRFYAHVGDHARRLTSVEANAKFLTPDTDAKAPLNSTGSDLKSVVSLLKQKYGLKYIYAWHALGAFWGGIGMEMKKYKPSLLYPTPLPGILEADPAVAWDRPVMNGLCLPLNPTELHEDVHKYLSGCGIDGVKVDVQGMIGLAGSVVNGGPSLASVYHASLEQSAKTHFPGNHLINCMCHSTEDVYAWEDTCLARVSDDFYPTKPASHTAHIANCAFNTLFLGELVIPDFDMFHSKHPAALLHATARAISGGPVYVSDKPGHHDFELLKRLVLSDGSVLRCKLPGRPTKECIFTDVSRDGRTALKMWNMNDVNGVIGVFNIQGSSFSRLHRAFHTHDTNPPTLRTIVHPADVATLVGTSNMYCLYSDALNTLTVVEEDQGIEIEVAPAKSDVVVVAPVKEESSGGGGVRFAAIGLKNMLNAGGAVLSVDFNNNNSKDDGNTAATVRMKVKGSGVFLAFATHCPVKVSVNGAAVEFEYVDGSGRLEFVVPVREEVTMVEADANECIIEF